MSVSEGAALGLPWERLGELHARRSAKSRRATWCIGPLAPEGFFTSANYCPGSGSAASDRLVRLGPGLPGWQSRRTSGNESPGVPPIASLIQLITDLPRTADANGKALRPMIYDS